VTVMTAADHGEAGADLYQLLGVGREASREEIAQAWRRRARAEHPDARPADAAAPGRFRALSQAWQVLSDPARRAAYDRARDIEQVTSRAAIRRVPVRHPPADRAPGGATPLLRTPEPPLRAGPVRVEGPAGPARAQFPRPAAGWDEEELRLALLAGLALRYLAARREPPW
jgi:curved DNA-binding protein CbpA